MVYSEAEKARIIETIISEIGNGITLREMCRRDGFPDHTTFYDWLKLDESASHRFARAREIGFDMLAEECLEIADNPKNGEDSLRSKLRVETRLKLLAKWIPKKYGEKLELAGDQDSPLTIAVKQYAGNLDPK